MIKQYSTEILKELGQTLLNISEEKALNIVESIMKAKKIFVLGTGRTGLVLKSFAMRLMQMDIEVYVVGETITPNMTENDFLLIGSGSGSTTSLVVSAKNASNIGVKIAVITAQKNSPIEQFAKETLFIDAPSKNKEIKYQSIQPLGSLFEQSLFIILDSIILHMMDILNHSSNKMFNRHANIE